MAGLPWMPRWPSLEKAWSIGVLEGPSPFELVAAPRPALHASMVHGTPAFFVAGPFVVRDNERWHMFMEVCEAPYRRGAIGHATSEDGIAWQFEGIVLREPFHLSYPCIVRRREEWFMTPESAADGCIRVYRALRFPRRWERLTIVVEQASLADPTLLQHADRWWLFAAAGRDQVVLFEAPEPWGPWRAHPQNPVVVGADRARPAGRPFAFGGRLYRPAQDCSCGYGRRVRAFEIVSLSATTYRESEQPTLMAQGAGRGRNARGMHHVDVHDAHGTWRAVADGFRLQVMFGYRPPWPRGTA